MSESGGSRRAARRAAVVLLYQHDLTGIPLAKLRENARQAEEAGDDPYTTMIVDGAMAMRTELDLRIDTAATGWSVERLGVIERAILRVATWELAESPDVPPAVAVNEAVELAKRYCGAQAPGFVNGILSNVLTGENRAEGAPDD